MPYTIYWDTARRDIIRIDTTAPFSWDEYNQLVLDIYKMVASVEYRVDIIADMRNSGRLSANEASLQQIKRGREIRPDNYGITVNVGTDPITKTVLDTGVALSENHRKPRPLVDTIEEAYAEIEKVRAKDTST